MISVAEALEFCLAEAARLTPFPSEELPLDESLDRLLAEDIVSEIDSPPFDKALMDGFAVRSGDIQSGASLRVLEEITAGKVPTKPVELGTATRIMTGAPIPQGSDAVVRVEESEFDPASSLVRFSISQIALGESILKRGASLEKGSKVLASGTLLRPQEIGVLAELGKAIVRVRKRPNVAVLATGDELVPISQTPKPGQIRNSNETMLAAQIKRSGGLAEKLGIARDERTHLAEKIDAGLKCDLLILSGGVSAGTRDLVPSELANAGVREIFHQVNVKPGKPVWFGVKDAADSPCLVFGLPGNPVSSMVCFELFARPVIRCLLGYESPHPDLIAAQLVGEFHSRGDRVVYHPAFLECSQVATVKLIPWIGSADLRATANANAMAILPTGNVTYESGTLLDVIPW